VHKFGHLSELYQDARSEKYCFEGRNFLYSMDRGLGKPRILFGCFGKERILLYLPCSVTLFLGSPVRSLEPIE